MPHLRVRTAIIACLSFSAASIAQNESVGGVVLSEANPPRLTRLSNDVSDYQQSPFMSVVDADFYSCKTVGEAFAKLAEFVGYSFVVSGESIDPMAKTFFLKPLSIVHKKFAHSTVRDAMISLAGDSYTVVVDHSIRAISVDIKPSHRVMSKLDMEARQ